MKYDFHLHDAVRVEYRVLAGPNLAPDCARIERETRCAGGNGVVAAMALARCGARVLLTGNHIGDDAHGQFLVRELQKVPNLWFEPTIEAGFQTPYAIFIQTAAPLVTSLLSPRAAPLQLEARFSSQEAAQFWSACSESSFPGAPCELDASTQNYEALLLSLRRAVVMCQLWSGAAGEADEVASRVVAHYEAAFDGPHVLLSREEIAALGRAER
ncbi:MAG TPA: hypothetical protein VF627_07875 [Abditibacterium sp.]|jgi:hypothetical protein